MKAQKISCLFLIFFLSIVLLTSCAEAGKNSGSGFVDGRNFGGIIATTPIEEEATRSTAVFSGACFGVIVDIDTLENTISLLDLVINTEVQFGYSGGTFIMDKYGKDISISQLAIGDIVEGGYDTGTRMLKELQKSDQAWENQSVTNFTINKLQHTIQIGKSLYEYTDQLVIVSDGRRLSSPSEISNQDELLVRGSENTIHSITILKGHGYVTLSNAEDFENGIVMVGSRIARKVTDGMVIEVPEGEYILEISKDGVGGRQNILVVKNEETNVDVGALKGESKQTGSLRFMLKPEGAKLYIDNKETDYKELVKLYYGSYKIRIEAEGYVPYNGDLLVSENYQRREIQLGKTEDSTQGEQESDISNTQQVTEKTTTKTEEEISASSATTANPTTTPRVTEPTVTIPTVAKPTVTEPTVTTPSIPVPSERLPEGMGSDTEGEKVENYRIHVEAPVGAAVYFDGEYKGIAPVSFQKVSGEHTIIFRQNGYETKTYTVTISSDKADTHYSYPSLEPN